MSSETNTRLQAMHHSNQVSSYLIAKVPRGELSTGWIEQGLIAKGVSGSLSDKRNQERLLIPTDRFTRLSRDYDTNTQYGLFIIGKQGMNMSKFVSLVINYNSQNMNYEAIGLNTNLIQVKDIINFISSFALESTKTKDIGEPNLDYIEALIGMTASGTSNYLLSLQVPDRKQKPLTWLRKILKTELDSESVIARHGNLEDQFPTILLFSRWLFGLDIFKKTENAVASIIFANKGNIDLYLWDSSQNLITFSSIIGTDLYKALNLILPPLWIASADLANKSKSGPEVVVGTKREVMTSTVKQKPSPSRDVKSLSILQTRLKELRTRLSQSISTVVILKKRIQKIVKNSRDSSMNDKSTEILEELQKIENETKLLQSISSTLEKLDAQLKDATSPDSTESPLGPDDIQRIVAKMTELRELIDKIEIEMDALDSHANEIESLKFKSRTKG